MSEQNAKRDWSEARRRNRQRVNLRVTDAEAERLEQSAANLQVSVSAYVKSVALGQPVPRRTSRPVNADTAAILKLLAELGKVGSNANQIARANNVLARAVVSENLSDVREVKTAVATGNENLEQINITLEALRSVIFDALNLK